MLLKIIPQLFSICKVKDYTEVDLTSVYTFIGKTPRECSLVCPTSATPKNTIERDDGWRGFFIDGVLDFSLIGILAKISDILAKEKIGIFVISTYNTDYIFVKENNFPSALSALTKAGYSIEE